MVVLNYSSANKYIKTELYDRGKGKERPFIRLCTDVMERAKLSNDSSLKFSTLASKTLSGKSKSFDSFFSPHSLKNVLKRDYFVFTFRHAIVQMSLCYLTKGLTKKNPNTTKFASS